MKNVNLPALLLRASAAIFAATLAVAPIDAQARQQADGARQALDRTKAPVPGKSPELVVPTWTKSKLANGAELVVSRKTGLPLVSVHVNFVGGSSQFEDAARLGVASLAAGMLSEGTSTRSGDQLSNAQQLLGTSISASVGNESGWVRFTALSNKLEQALELMADMLLNPSFPDEALQRQKGQMIVGLTTGRDNPNTIATNVFSKVLYGDEHPYGRVVTEKTVASITRDDIVAFHRAYYRPGRAVITVVGDVEPASVRSAMEKAFANWQAGGERPTFAYPSVPALRDRTIYLVDKPKAAQSRFMLGLPGPSRDNPDYFSIQVMNTIVGQLMLSRLQRVIREEKGYAYGANSFFRFGRGPGAFVAFSSIVTAKTDSGLFYFMKELRGAQGEHPFTDDEMRQGKDALVQSLPAQFGPVFNVALAISGIYTQDLPENYYGEFASKINAVTANDVERVAKKYIDLDKLNIIIVGDRAVIEEALRRMGIAPIVLLDIDGKPVPAVTP